jgi:hypothetical protein
MRIKISEFLKDVAGEIAFGLRCLCGRPTPMKRFIMVAIAGTAMGIASFCILVSSIYNLGHDNAQKEMPELNIIRQLNLKTDSINNLKQKLYEYEQEQSDN